MTSNSRQEIQKNIFDLIPHLLSSNQYYHTYLDIYEEDMRDFFKKLLQITNGILKYNSRKIEKINTSNFLIIINLEYNHNDFSSASELTFNFQQEFEPVIICNKLNQFLWNNGYTGEKYFFEINENVSNGYFVFSDFEVEYELYKTGMLNRENNKPSRDDDYVYFWKKYNEKLNSNYLVLENSLKAKGILCTLNDKLNYSLSLLAKKLADDLDAKVVNFQEKKSFHLTFKDKQVIKVTLVHPIIQIYKKELFIRLKQILGINKISPLTVKVKDSIVNLHNTPVYSENDQLIFKTLFDLSIGLMLKCRNKIYIPYYFIESDWSKVKVNPELSSFEINQTENILVSMKKIFDEYNTLYLKTNKLFSEFHEPLEFIEKETKTIEFKSENLLIEFDRLLHELKATSSIINFDIIKVE